MERLGSPHGLVPEKSRPTGYRCTPFLETQEAGASRAARSQAEPWERDAGLSMERLGSPHGLVPTEARLTGYIAYETKMVCRHHRHFADGTVTFGLPHCEHLLSGLLKKGEFAT